MIKISKKWYLPVALVAGIISTGCSPTYQDSARSYPRKPPVREDRKAGAAMMLYEQAEKDMDVNDSVIVIPPDKKTGGSKDN